MKKWNVSVSIQTGVFLEAVEAHDPETLKDGDLDYEEVVKALIEQLHEGQASLDFIVEEVQTLDGRVVQFDSPI